MGDVQNAAERVRKLARALQFPHLQGMRLESGGVQDLLRLLHFALLDSSRALAAFLVDKGYDLYGKTDARFVESVFRLLRDEFRVFPSLSAAQFLSPQFVERRLALTADVLALAIRTRKELQRQRRQRDAVWSEPTAAKAPAAAVDNHVLPPEVVDHAALLLERLGVMQRGRSDSGGGRRVRALRVRQRDAQPPSARFQGLDDGARVEEVGGRQQATAYRATFSWSDGSRRSDADRDEGGHADRNGGTPLSEPQSSPQQHSPSVDQALVAIRQQLSSLSDTLLDKISSVEDRLDALETRVSGLHASVLQLQQAQRSQEAPPPPLHPREQATAFRDGGDRTSHPKSSDAFEKRSDSSCMWPSSAAMFERY